MDIDKELDKLVDEINLKGKGFLKQYLISLSEQALAEEEELKVADVAVVQTTIWPKTYVLTICKCTMTISTR